MRKSFTRDASALQIEPALEAIKCENDRILDKMIEEDSRTISWRDPIDNMSLLHKAAVLNSYNCSQVLLHRGADPYSTIPNCEWTPIHLAARDSSFSIVKAYIDYKIDPNTVDEDGRTILHIAAMHGNVEFLEQLLELGKFDLDESNLNVQSKGWNPLHYSSWYGHDRIVLLLLKKGANSILTDKDGYSPLHLAVESQNLVSLKLLLADIRAKLTPSGWSEILSECVGVARGMKNDSLVEFLKRWDVESKTGPDPFPLHLAVQNADLTEVKKILNSGICKINERNTKGETALHLAAKLDLEQIVEFLLAEGADVQVTVRGTNLNALNLAVQSNKFKTAKLLGMELPDSSTTPKEYV